jgi:hypothetical protein
MKYVKMNVFTEERLWRLDRGAVISILLTGVLNEINSEFVDLVKPTNNLNRGVLLVCRVLSQHIYVPVAGFES